MIDKTSFNKVEGADKIWDFGKSHLTYARKGGKIGFIDKTGKWVIEPQFEAARAFNKGLAPVRIGKLWGYCDETGTLIIKPSYPDAEVFGDNGLAPVKIKGWGFLDTKGVLVIAAEYEITGFGFGIFKGEEKGFIGNLARVKKDKKWGFIKPDGSVLGNIWFENAEFFQE